MTCCSLTHRQADFCIIFCSAEIFSTSLHQGRALFVHLLFHFFFAEVTFLAGHAGGHPLGCPHRAGPILSKKKEEKKGEKKNPEARISNQMNLMKNEKKNSSKMFSRPTTRRIGEMNIRLLANSVPRDARTELDACTGSSEAARNSTDGWSRPLAPRR